MSSNNVFFANNHTFICTYNKSVLTDNFCYPQIFEDPELCPQKL
jgi:hypothetical protein